MIAIDFETYLISEEMPSPKPVCLSYKYWKGEEGIVTGMDGMEAFLKDILSSDNKVIAHNMSFEANVIDAWFPTLRPLLRDKMDKNQMVCTKIYEQLLSNIVERPTNKFSLADLVDKYFKEDISAGKKDPDAWRLRYAELENVKLEDWPEAAVSYAIDDSIWALKVYLEQRKKYLDISVSVKADYYLNKMGQYGLEVDSSRVLSLKQELLDILNPLYSSLIDKGLCSVNSKGKVKKNMKEFREILVKDLPEVEKTSSGNVSTSSESLERYLAVANESREAIESFIKISKYEKILTAFISRLEGAKLIRTQYKACVSSGRTSSSTSNAYPSVNIQQMPRTVPGTTYDIRNCFKARDGRVIVSIDYNGLELASAAHQLSLVSGLNDMQMLINSGDKPVDMHSMFACRLKSIKDNRKVTYEEFVAHKKEPGYKEYRALAKPINLGFPGGIGYDNMRSLLIRDGVYPFLQILSTSKREENLNYQRGIFRKQGYPVRVRRVGFQEYQLVKDELVDLKDQMFSLYPDLEKFLKEVHLTKLTGKVKPVKNEYGEWESEPMYSYSTGGFNRDWCMYTQICNGFLMQSPSAIGAKKAMIEIIKKYGDSDTVRPLAFIHDEVVFEVLDNEDKYAIIEDISRILIEQMQTVLYSVRIAVEADITGTHWAKEGTGKTITYWKNPKEDKLYEE